ncbi:MAG: DNA polymerase III subunit gamma/tau [Cellvibrionaceae bacterium]
MSYQVLARKWRPRIFREMVGQEHVLKALINALDHNRLHHAYLFTGTRGVGKTTIARILAKCLNCETGVSSEPCDKCASCCEINEGRFVDLIEVDAASRTKVEDTRELLDNVQYAPTKGRYKVYLIDEVHMLSGHSFNALLKTLEEPPPHVKFLLATTDPQKLPVTILSRCLQFNLKNMTSERIVDHLDHILEREMIPFEHSALWLLGRSADGSMRDALSLTDQAIAFGNGKVTEDDVSSMLGTIDQKQVYEMVHALTVCDAKKLLDCVEALAEQSPDYNDALASLINILHRIAIAQVLPEAVDNTFGDRDEILQMAQLLPAEDVQLFYQTAILGRRDLNLSPDLRGGFEMILLRMIAFKPQGLVEIPEKALNVNTPSAISPSETDNSGEDASVKKSEVAAVAATENPTKPVSDTVSDQIFTDLDPVDQSKKEIEKECIDDEILKDKTIEKIDNNTHHHLLDNNVRHHEVKHQKVKPHERLNENDKRGDGDNQAPTVQPLSEDRLTHQNQLSSDVQPSIEKRLASEKQLTSENQSSTKLSIDSAKIAVIKPTKQYIKQYVFDSVQPEDWVDVVAQLAIGGVIQNTVMNCQLIARDNEGFQFVLDERNSTLYDEGHQKRLADILTDYFQRSVSVNIQLGEVTQETPAMTAFRLKEARQAEALESLQNDPLVKDIIQMFGATLKIESIKPIDPES